MFSNVRVDISYRLMQVTENIIIDGLDQSSEEGVIFVTESLHIENGSSVEIKNACLIILGDLSGAGTLNIHSSSTVMLEGDKQGKVTFLNRYLADDTCQYSTGTKSFKDITEVPEGLRYSLYSPEGRLLDKGIIDDFIKYNFISAKTFVIKIEGYKSKKIVFKP